MSTNTQDLLRGELLNRRARLLTAIGQHGERSQLTGLLHDVDAALERMAEGSYGLCETCHDTIEAERLMADPLVRFCLDHLTTAEQRELEEDLQLSRRIQQELLPKKNLHSDGWEIDYYYRPAGLVSGDYCDVIFGPDGSLYVLIGDVSGKGVAAAMLMSHLHAMFRALIPVGLPLQHLVERASRVFCESTLPTHYATLVCSRLTDSGAVQLCNAGHLPALLLANNSSAKVEATGMPLGLFCGQDFALQNVTLSHGESLIFYTDGLSEAQDGGGNMYGFERLEAAAGRTRGLSASGLIAACLEDLQLFQNGVAGTDDLTIMAIRKL